MPPETSSSPQIPQPQNPQLKQIRTFQGDVAEALGRQKESLASIQQTASLKRRLSPIDTTETEATEKKRKNVLFFISGITLFVITILGGLYTYGEYVRKITAPTVAPPANRLITPSSEVVLDTTGLTRSSLILALDKAASSMTLDELKHVVLRTEGVSESTLLSTEGFLRLLGTSAPNSLVRAFEPVFMLGLSGQNRFLIFKLSSFENAFPGMLAWESTIAEDLGPLFSTSALLKGITPAPASFHDLTIKNKDIRVLEVDSTPGLLYTFYDNDTLVITDSLETLQTLIDRLAREKLSR